MEEKDGVYRWRYDLDTERNRSILKLVLSIVYGMLAGITLILMVLTSWQDVGGILKVMVPIALVIFPICLGADKLVSMMYHGTYTMLFEMDEKGIRFSQTEKGKEIVGAIQGAVSGPAAGMPVPTSAYSEFRKVTSVRADRKDELIRVSSPFLLNMVYVDRKDYDFVLDYIIRRCPQARIHR